ncbi:MAG: adenosine kinase [Bacteroidaceae bacterium]|nr:adenosine kinase [Bacteroidaceae bacterium]
MKKIIGIGNALVDVLVQIDNDSLLTTLGLPKGGMQLIDERQQQVLNQRMQSLHPQKATGGSAGNTILALANLGLKPGFIGKVGKDQMGDFYAENCSQTGIETLLTTCETHTGVANTFISADGERTFGTYLGAAALMQAAEITASMFQGYQLLHIEGYLVQNHELIEKICQTAKQEGLMLSIDLASYNVIQTNLSFFQHLVKDYIDIVFANEEECTAFTGEADPKNGLRKIADLCRLAIVKLGSKGATAMWGISSEQYGTTAFVPAKKVKVIDTTAAGDFFAGGFLYALGTGATLENCLQAGALLSSNVIQVVGTRLSDETWEKIRSSIKQLY